MRLNITQVACFVSLLSCVLYGYGIGVRSIALMIVGMVSCIGSTIVAVRTGI
jgi:hypothetical protein